MSPSTQYCFLSTVNACAGPTNSRLDHDKQHIAEVMDFLSVTISSSSTLRWLTARRRWMLARDPRRQHRHGNDPQRQYVRDWVSGLGERWFTAPVNTPQGLFSPASRRSRRTRIWAIARLPNLWYRRCGNDRSAWRNALCRAGGMEAARAVSEEMAEIYLSAICSCRSQAGIFRARAWD